MSNPLRLIRKYQKRLLAVFVILLMMAFVLQAALTSVSPNGSGGSTKEVTLVKWAGGKLTDQDFNQFRIRHNAAQAFLMDLTQRALANGGVPRVSAQLLPIREETEESNEDILDIMMMAERGRRMGLVVSDEAVLEYLDAVCSEEVSRDEYSDLIRSLTANNINFAMLRSQLKTELLALTVQDMSYAGIVSGRRPIITPLQAYAQQSREQIRYTCELLPIPVSEYEKGVGQPTKSEMRELYLRGQSFLPDPTLKRPGFREPRKVAVESFSGDAADFGPKPEAIPLAEVQAEYERIKLEEANRLWQTDTPSTQPGASDSDAETQENGGTQEGADTETGTDTQAGDDSGAVDGSNEPAPANDDAEAGSEAADLGGKPGTSDGESMKTDDPSGDGSNGDDTTTTSGESSSAGDDSSDSSQEGESEESGANDSSEKSGEDAAGEVPLEGPANGDQSGVSRNPSVMYVSTAQQDDTGGLNSASGDAGAATDTAGSQDEDPAPVEKAPDEKAPVEATSQDEPSTSSEATAETPDASSEPADAEQPATADQSTSETPTIDPPGGGNLPLGPPSNVLPGGLGGLPSTQPDSAKLPELKTFEEAEEMIRKAMSESRGREVLAERLTEARLQVEDYYAVRLDWEIDSKMGETDEDAPTPPDFKAIARKYGLKYESTGLVDRNALSATTIGGEFISNNTVAGYVFQPEVRLYNAEPIDPSTFLFWVSEVVPAHSPSFEDAQESVIEYWTKSKAIEAAIKAGEAIAKGVKDKKSTLAEVEKGVITTTPFSWLSSNLPFGQGFAQLSEVSGTDANGKEVKLDDLGDDFMRKVFATPKGGFTVAADNDRTNAYVVQVTEVGGIPAEIRREAVIGWTEQQIPFMVGFDEAQEVLSTWMVDLQEEMKVEWLQ